MGLFDRPAAVDALEDMLDRERRAVLNARFDVLERLAKEKERLLNAVARETPGLDALTRLKQGCERNNRLLEAMREGVMAARGRIEAVHRPAKALNTYDASGRKSVIAGPAGKATRRA